MEPRLRPVDVADGQQARNLDLVEKSIKHLKALDFQVFEVCHHMQENPRVTQLSRKVALA